MSETLFGYHLLSQYAVTNGGVDAVRLTKAGLRSYFENLLKEQKKEADGEVTFRTYAQSGFNPKDLLYKEAPWIVGTPLPEWAMLVRVEAEVFTV